jgi:hypothetical protein
VERAVLQGVLIDEAIEVLFQFARHFGRSPGAGAIQQALGPLLRKALHPFAEGGIGQMERLGDGVDMVAGHDLPDRLRTAKDPRFLGLLEQGIEGRQRTIGKVAFEGTHGCAPGERRTFVLHMICGA